MTAATGRVFGPKTISENAISPAGRRALAASVAPFKFWLLGLNSSGLAVAQAAGVTGLVSLGFAERDEAAGTSDSDAHIVTRQQFVSGFPNSTGSGDAILDTDYAVACWAVDNQTIGRKTNLSSVNRSLLGLAFGIDPDSNTPIFYPGPIGWTLGRAAHMGDNAPGGALYKVVDAGAGTDTVNGLAEALVPRPRLHGTVAAVEFAVEGTTLAASGNTDFTTLTLYKRDGAGGSAVAVASITTKTIAFTQWTTVSFTLSAVAGAIDLLETDLLTLVKTHGSSGAVVPAGALRVVLRVC